MNKMAIGRRNCNTYWDFLTNRTHMIVDAKHVKVDKQTEEVKIEASKNLKQSKSMRRQKSNSRPERRSTKSKTVVIQTEFRAKYVKLRIFDKNPNDIFLIENFKERWTQNHVKFIAPSQAEGE
jgi:hypothetical protein